MLYQDVSILVLMDYHFLYLNPGLIVSVIKSFNPCFNGLSFLIYKFKIRETGCNFVSILVLMDYHFLYGDEKIIMDMERSFNPCFNGLSFLIIIFNKYKKSFELCFNPCFNGLSFLI